MSPSHTSLVWFRNDLRIADNHSLLHAIKSPHQVIGLYCFDPRHFAETSFGFRKTEKFRAKFLLETVAGLKQNLEQLGIPLLVYVAQPENVIPRLVGQYHIKQVFSQKEWTSEEETVYQNVKAAVPPKILFHEVYDQFLYHPADVPFEVQKLPNVFTNFRKKCEKYASVKSIESLPQIEQKPISNPTTLPTLPDLGFQEFQVDRRTAFPFKGGENEALARLESYFFETQKLAYYKKTRNGLLGTDYSSKFSPWLANGSISPRTIYWKVREFEAQIRKNDSTYWLIFELIWRDFFKYISMKYGNRIFQIGGILARDYTWDTNEQKVQAWMQGTTPEPFVNANMLELKHTGWMSNRGRQNVASYFAKEWCLDWRIGAAYFESLLLDYDVHSNYGNWMYVAGVGNDPRDRKFNVRLQAERYDAQGNYQSHWLQQTLFS